MMTTPVPNDTTMDIPDALIYSRRLQSVATYIDANPVAKLDVPDLVYDQDAILAAIRNLLMCPIGGRGRIFNPRFGSLLYSLLQEPYDSLTAHQIEQATLQAITTWEPRVEVRMCNVVTDDNLPGYVINLQLSIIATGKVFSGSLDVPA
jgi:phage baseplate assembly protein W